MLPSCCRKPFQLRTRKPSPKTQKTSERQTHEAERHFSSVRVFSLLWDRQMSDEARCFCWPSGVAGLPADVGPWGVRRDAEGQAALQTHLAAWRGPVQQVSHSPTLMTSLRSEHIQKAQTNTRVHECWCICTVNARTGPADMQQIHGYTERANSCSLKMHTTRPLCFYNLTFVWGACWNAK